MLQGGVKRPAATIKANSENPFLLLLLFLIPAARGGGKPIRGNLRESAKLHLHINRPFLPPSLPPSLLSSFPPSARLEPHLHTSIANCGFIFQKCEIHLFNYLNII